MADSSFSFSFSFLALLGIESRASSLCSTT
jgi:hypothetical protein